MRSTTAALALGLALAGASATPALADHFAADHPACDNPGESNDVHCPASTTVTTGGSTTVTTGGTTTTESDESVLPTVITRDPGGVEGAGTGTPSGVNTGAGGTAGTGARSTLLLVGGGAMVLGSAFGMRRASRGHKA